MTSALSGEKARSRYKTLVQLAGVCLVCYGISLIYLPAALIVGGIVVVAALEVR